jgi:DNA-directed RNA polymerase subunit M/transcription elongation factor TFIIS
MILFVCPSCNKRLEAEEQGIGLVVPCPACNTQVTIPNSDVKVRIAPVSSPSSAHVDSTKPRTSAIDAGLICLVISVIAQFIGLIWLHTHPLNMGQILFFGLPFHLAAIVCAIVAMCTDQVKHGILLLAATTLAVVLFLGLYEREISASAERMQQQMMMDTQKQFQNLFPRR